MSFFPILPFGGLQGWQFLMRTLPRQTEAFEKSTVNQREVEYFSEVIFSIDSAEELVSDRRALSFALTAFGLEGDLDNKFLIKKILEEGTLSPESLANKFSDKRYYELSKAFGFGPLEATRTGSSEFVNRIIVQYEENAFRAAVGAQDATMRLAISFNDDVKEIINSSTTNNARWLAVLGNPPVKKVIETALRIPSGSINQGIDQQIETLKDRLESLSGSDDLLSIFDDEVSEKLVRNFLLFDGGGFTRSTGSQNALTLLRGAKSSV